MAYVRCAAFDYLKECIAKSKKVTSFGWSRYNAVNFRISLRINWIIILSIIASILSCQFAESTATRQISYGRKHHNQQCWISMRRPMVLNQMTSIIAKEPTIKPQDILSRLEVAAVLRDNLIAALGRVLLVCLDDNARIPFQIIHDAVRFRRVAAYELLRILPVLTDKPPQQQLYKLLRILERVGSRFISGYASLCVNVFHDVETALTKRASLTDMLLNVDAKVIDSVSRDRHRIGTLPSSLRESIDFLLRAVRNDSRIMNLRVVSAILLNYPTFDLTDPEIHGAMRFVAQQMRERSRPEDPLLHDAMQHQNAEDLLKTVLERLEVDELSCNATKEASSLLLENLGKESYPPTPDWKHNLKKLLMITSDRYPVKVIAVAKYLIDHLDDSHLHDLDIGFYETDDYARLQILSRLRRKANLQHLRKPLSLLITFVSQKLMNDADHEYTVPISFYEVNDYLDSFDMPCLQDSIRDAMNTMRPHLSKNLPWSYAFRNRRTSNNPWELTLTSLAHLRSVPVNRSQAIAIDNFVYKGNVDTLAGKRGPLYNSGIIFQRDDTMNVEIDFYSLLMCIPNIFKNEKFIPLLNFLSKPNILDVLGYEFNKFDYETPRDLLLALLKRALTFPLVKSDESLFRVLQNACNYLEEPLLINLYTTEDLQILLKHLPGIEDDPRYLPLKILFEKQKLFEYLSPTFSLVGLNTPMERLLLILKTVSLKVTEPKIFDALSFALENLEESPLLVRTFNYDDFVYLIQQLLPYNKSLQTAILTSSVYTNISNWNVSVSGTPENVLARALSYPVDSIANHTKLAALVKRTEEILEEKGPLSIKCLKKRTLEELLEYLPNSTHVKSVSLLLKKANLIALMPTLNLTELESISERDPRYALITLLKNLTESRMIRAEKLLLDRVEATLSFLKHANPSKRQIPIVAYLIQALRDPSNIVYEPLLRELMQLQNVTIPLDERQAWLRIYLQQMIAQNKTEKLGEAATMALREINMNYKDFNEKLRASRTRLEEAALLLPTDLFSEPLRQLLTPDWMYNILPEDSRDAVSLNKEELLLTILHYAKQQTDIANNRVLMKAITKTVMHLKWRTSIESLKNTVTDLKAAVYDPVKNLLTARGLNKLKITIPPDRSAIKSLLELLQHLLLHPAITKNNKVSKLLRIVRQDSLAFSENVDLLAVLDDVGIPRTNELAPIRLSLLSMDVTKQFGRTIFALADPKERYRTLLNILQKSCQTNNDMRFFDALSSLKNIKLGEREPPSTLVSNLYEIVNAIPHQIKKKFKHMEYLFNNDTLSHLTSDNEIVESKNPLATLLLKIADLPEVSNNYTAANELKRMHFEIELLDNYSIVTGFQLRPLLLVLQQVQQINVDFMNSILAPEMLNYLDIKEFSNVTDSIEILKNVIDYLLYNGSTYIDGNMQKHLQSFKRTMALTLGSNIIPELQLTDVDWKNMLTLIPHREVFAPVRMLLQSKKVFEHVPYYESINWKLFPTSTKKLLRLLLLLENSDVENKDVYKSASKLRINLEKRFNFVTEQNVTNMHHILESLGSQHDLSALKIFLNHNNMIKYLPSNFRYNKYSTPIDAFVGVLDNLLQVRSLRQETFLYEAMKVTRRSLYEQNSRRRSWIHNVFAHKYLSSKDLEFVNSFNVFEPRLRKFLNPEKLLSLLPESFTFKNRVTFKTKALHLLRYLLELNTDVHLELEKLLRQVMAYPDVSDITKNDLAPLLKILPIKVNISHIELVKNYLKPSTLIRLLPGNFNIKQTRNAKVALHNVLSLLNNTLGSAKNRKLKIALHALLSELDKINSSTVPEKRKVDNNDVKSIISEIPFKQYKQLLQLEVDMTPTKIISSLPLSFQLTKYKTKKLQLLAILDALLKNDTYRSSLDAINFAKRIVNEMPDVPAVNDVEIKKLLLSLPLNIIHVTHLVKNCEVATLTPYLPIHFNLSSVESRKTKIAKILQYCELANSSNIDAKQAFSNVKTLLKTIPDFDVTRDHLQVLIGTIPCAHFSSIKPLLQFLSKRNITSLLPWNLDLYETSRTFKLRILDLLAALRNIKELRNDKMLFAFESLEMDVKSLPDAVLVTPDHMAALKSSKRFDIKSCADYGKFVTKTENLIKIMPPTYRFEPANSNPDDIDAEWSSIMYFSTLFLRDVRADGPMRDAFEACRDNMHTNDKNRILHYLQSQINRVSFKETIVPLRLYVLGHADTFTTFIDNTHHGFLRGTMPQYIRLVLREFIRRSELTRSKSLIDSLHVFLHDYMIVQLRDAPSHYEIDQAISEIPSDDEYNDIRLLMQCRDIQTPIMEKNLSADGTTKQLLLDMLRLVDKSEIEEKTRQNIKSLELYLEQAIREEEVNHVLKQMRDYRYHISKMKPIKAYLVRNGLQRILGDDYRTKYPLYKDRLLAINNTLMTTNLTSDLFAASNYLNKILKNEVKIKHIIPRTMDDINVQTLFFALPKTRDERIIRGIVKFFSNPNLLRKLNLPKDPFEYETKGRLLQAIINLGVELESVQKDIVQQEALEYFSDKILITGHGAQPIELKKNAYDFNVNVDIYGVMRAINYTKANVTDAMKVVMFFEREYNLINAMSFNHVAYATRGAYLKALLEHFVNVSQVPDGIQQSIALLIPAVRLDGPGDEAVDLNDDIIQNETNTEKSSRFLNASHDAGFSFSGRNTSSRTDFLQTFRKNKESLHSAVNNMFDSMSSSEKKFLGHINEQSFNISTLNNLTNMLIVDRAGTENRNDGPIEVSEISSNNIPNIIPEELDIKYKIMRKVRRIKLKDDWGWKTKSNSLDYLNSRVSNVSFKAERKMFKIHSMPSKLSPEEQLRKSRYSHQMHHKRVARKSPIQSNLNDNSKSLSLNKELMAAQTNDERRTVKKDLSRSIRKIP